MKSNKMTLIITGSRGLLGQELIAQSYCNHPDIEVVPLDRTECDITNYNQCREKIGSEVRRHYRESYFPHVFLINCAAITTLQRCIENKKLAYDTNAKALEELVDMTRTYNGLILFQISTDYVFDGSDSFGGMYKEEDLCNPLSYYAKTKWAAEIIINSVKNKNLSDRSRIIRTSFCRKVWPHEAAFFDKITTGDSVDVIAKMIINAVIKYNKWEGILHIGTERKTFADLARKSKPNIKEISRLSVKDGHLIPADTTLNCGKAMMIGV